VFLQNCWYMAGWSTDFSDDSIVPVTVLDQPIAVYRKRSGAFAALEDLCPHRLVPLSVGRKEQDDIRCMYHGLKFGPDGKCVEIPGQTHISNAVCVRSYPVVEKHGCVWIWMGLAKKVDEALIPAIIGPDDPKWSMQTSMLEIAANAGLIADNLLDLSHAPYVHEATFAGGNKEAAASLIAGELTREVTVIERGVHFERWHLNRQSSPYMGNTPADNFVVNDFSAPGVFMLTNRFYPLGVRDRHQGEILEDPILAVATCQMITPVTDQMSKFFYGFAVWAKNPELKEKFFDLATVAFGEDKTIIEVQQSTMNRASDRKVMALGMDSAIVRYQSVMKRLLAEDQALIDA
jgi:phenylpropionate dioxygenase-like ring-hydroxylating dioxygenase large terminal subunit